MPLIGFLHLQITQQRSLVVSAESHKNFIQFMLAVKYLIFEEKFYLNLH